MTERITSRANAYIRHVKKLRTDRAYRYEHGEYVADGSKLLCEALKWNVPLSAVLVQDGVTVPSLPDGVRIISVPETVMQEASRMQTPQGVIAVCKMPEAPQLHIEPGCIILDTVQDPGNLGTILRTADAFDIPVILSEGCADPYGEKTVRATMGVPFRTRIMQAGTGEIISACKAVKIPLVVTALTDRAKDLRELPLSTCAVVIGSEGRGASEAFLSAADAEAVIPMSSRCESLNAGVAAAIVMWQMRQ